MKWLLVSLLLLPQGILGGPFMELVVKNHTPAPVPTNTTLENISTDPTSTNTTTHTPSNARLSASSRRHHCGTRNFRKGDTNYETNFKQKRKSMRFEGTFPVKVDVWFHIVEPQNPTIKVSREAAIEQVRVLNNDFAPTGLFNFTLKGMTRTVSDNWFNLNPEGQTQKEMKTKLRKGDSSALNIYSVNLSDGVLGYATFPQDYTKDPMDDGVVIMYNTIPKLAAPPYNLGKTLTHEVGHWMGLYHVFEGGCSFPGDYVDDTTPQADATSGCPVRGIKSCQESSFKSDDDKLTFNMNYSESNATDNYTNFMDYSDDACLRSGFSAGQIKRMKAVWMTLRGNTGK